MSEKKVVQVAIALVWRDGELLVSRRRAGQHLGGFWEFPGGKLEPGEAPGRCAEREVAEEVGLVVRAERERPLIRHEYAERIVELHPVDCRYESGEPRALEVAEVRWLQPAELAALELPPANAPLVAELVRAAQDSSGLR